jgi:hypothetical protein
MILEDPATKKFQIGAHVPSTLIAYLSGFFTAVGWWIFIDGLVYGLAVGAFDHVPYAMFWYWIPGVGETCFLLLLNFVNAADLRTHNLDYDQTRGRFIKVRAILEDCFPFKCLRMPSYVL